MGDEDVTKKSGIYEYLLTGEEKKLSIRAFDRRDALAAYEKQNINAQFAAKNLSLSRCTLIILRRGARVEKRHLIIARCFAATAI